MNCCQLLIETALYMSNKKFMDLVWIENNDRKLRYVAELYEEKRDYDNETFSLYGFNQHDYLHTL